MKQLFVSILTFFGFANVHALPIGNPAEATRPSIGFFWGENCEDLCDPCTCWCDGIRFRTGFYGDYVFNRHFEIQDNDDDDDELFIVGNSVIENTAMFTNAWYFVLNFWDRFDLFATLGSTNFLIEGNGSSFVPVALGSRFEIDTFSGFSWSVGGRLTLWECGCTVLGVEGQYFTTHPHVMRATFGDLISDYPRNNVRIRYSEWQLGVGLSHRINILIPYIAGKYSRAQLDFNNYLTSFDAFLSDIDSKNHWGYAVGVSVIVCEMALLTLEGRFCDEKALYMNGQVRF